MENKQKVMTVPENFPFDISAETLLSFFPEDGCSVSFRGLHKRNSYNDIVNIEEDNTDRLHVDIARFSLYNSLPEYMFHPIDRFDNLPQYEEKERFEEQLEAQQEEIAKAYRFFAPIDILLLKQRMDVKERVLPLAQQNRIMERIIGDNLTAEQLENRFIRLCIPFLPLCKNIRGNKTLLTFLLRKVLMEEGLQVEVHHMTELQRDEHPRYEESLDLTLGEGFMGNEYVDMVTVYDISYWSDDECNEKFLHFINEIEVFRVFLQDWFLAVGEELRFNIIQDELPLRLNDEVVYNYLNYNTNI